MPDLLFPGDGDHDFFAEKLFHYLKFDSDPLGPQRLREFRSRAASRECNQYYETNGLARREIVPDWIIGAFVLLRF